MRREGEANCDPKQDSTDEQADEACEPEGQQRRHVEGLVAGSLLGRSFTIAVQVTAYPRFPSLSLENPLMKSDEPWPRNKLVQGSPVRRRPAGSLLPPRRSLARCAALGAG